jgi:hypothetical protein
MSSVSSGLEELGPDIIRALRGGESRASFARKLGVTPHTVYRWELPDGSAEARRPRGPVLSRLRALVSGAHSEEFALPPAHVSPNGSAAAGDAAALSSAIAAFSRLMQGEWREAEPPLLQAVMAGAEASEDAAALGAAGLAFAEVLLRGDARAALSVLGAALSAAARDRLSPAVGSMVYAVAGLAHSLPDARFFDIGRVHAYQTRVESLALRGASGEARLLAGLATGWAAVLSGDNDLLFRAFAGLDQLVALGPPPAIALLSDEAIAFRALIFGRPAEHVRLTELVCARARSAGAALVEARTMATLASRNLDDLGPPARSLELARRSRELARAARAAPGLHTVFAGRAEAEALFRLGRLDEAAAVLAAIDDYWSETGIPAAAAISAQSRIYLLKDDVEAMASLAARLRRVTVPAVDRLAHACASLLEALMLLVRDDETPAAVSTAFDRAEEEAARWPFLLRDALVHRPMVFALDPDLPNPEVSLRRAQRLLDGFPSAWASAHLRRVEGLIRATRGQAVEGRQLLQAALATFEAGGCVPDAALVKQTLAMLAVSQGEPGADARVAEGEAALRGMGISVPLAFRRAAARVGGARRVSDPVRAATTAGGSPLEALEVAMQRLLVQGAAPPLVQHELVSVTEALFPGRAASLEEIDSNRVARNLDAVGGRPGGEERTVWVEFGDGAGRRLRLGVAGPLSPPERALLSVIAQAAGAALQVAVLRGLSIERGTRGPDAEVNLPPGFIAVSPLMRRLAADLARFAGSRATVIITGESGAGKEVVARAIHDLSPRAGRPYVAFNCAAVPRELFEGQLFGHRKGAFTGATSDQPGTIRSADGGTLFLDEVGELPLDVQPKLLRFLENGEVSPLGERRPVTVDVRIVAATHRDLEGLVRQGRFREDLFFRLQVIPLRVPPLRERPEDVAALARHFLRDLGPHRPGARTPVLSPDALATLASQSWPGNVRELRNVIERTLAYAPDAAVITAADLRLG